MSRGQHLARTLAVCAAIAAPAACVVPPLENPSPGVSEEWHAAVPQNPKDQIDVLFLVDNSPSMKPMSAALSARFREFLQVFRDTAARDGRYANLHIGVVTSDLGAPRTGVPACDDSDGGRLVTRGHAAPAGCKGPVGRPFIEFDFDPSAVGRSNLPDGQSLEDTFTCMASVGGEGCGYEHQLEAVYRALREVPENAGFLRDEARLAVVFVTNEDDCSAPPTTDLFDRSKTGYGDAGSFRCTRWGIQCAGLAPPDESGGLLASCVPAPNPNGLGPGLLYDVKRYIDLFTQPAPVGIKAAPEDVVLFAIVADDSKVETLRTADPSVEGRYAGCPAGSTCTAVLQRSCVKNSDRSFFGDPAVRLSTVVRAARVNQIESICANDYKDALAALGRLVQEPAPMCLTRRLADPAAPDCVVQDETRIDGQPTRIALLPRCDQAGSARPCWRVEATSQCDGKSPQGVAIVIDRGGQAAPPRTTTRISCATGP